MEGHSGDLGGGPDLDGRAIDLGELELAGGIPLGFDTAIDPLPAMNCGTDGPRMALEAALCRALTRPPCLVSFSGGRDSSAMLSLALSVANREGLAPPVAATLRIIGSDEANETEWQERVIGHLGLDDWVRIDITDHLDVVGPVATAALARYGLLWPFNTHFHQPIFAEAKGGSVVTGFGGDELGISSSTSVAERILAAKRIRSWSELMVVGLALAPGPLRRAVFARRDRQEISTQRPWLTDLGLTQVARKSGRSQSEIPLGWDRVLREAIWRSRYFRVCTYSLNLLAISEGAVAIHPLVDREVLRALGGVGGFAGLGSRTAIMKLLFGDLLPNETLARSTKATFDDAMWTRHARTFAEEWSGRGLPEHLVDVSSLRTEWRKERPHALSAVLLQAAWLHDHCFTGTSHNGAT